MIEGSFIVVEGIDGAGSTTVVSELARHFRGKKHAVHGTCEPSGGPIGSLIRQILSHRLVIPTEWGAASPGWATMALLFASDRLDHLQAEVLPRLRDGVMVVSDRYDLSSLAYQSATAATGDRADGGRVVAWIRELNRQARRPDLTVVLDVRPEVAAERRKIRGGAKELYEDSDMQLRLAEAYASAEKLVPEDRLVHVDANLPLEAVISASVAAVEAFLSR